MSYVDGAILDEQYVSNSYVKYSEVSVAWKYDGNKYILLTTDNGCPKWLVRNLKQSVIWIMC